MPLVSHGSHGNLSSPKHEIPPHSWTMFTWTSLYSPSPRLRTPSPHRDPSAHPRRHVQIVHCVVRVIVGKRAGATKLKCLLVYFIVFHVVANKYRLTWVFFCTGNLIACPGTSTGNLYQKKVIILEAPLEKAYRIGWFKGVELLLDRGVSPRHEKRTAFHDPPCALLWTCKERYADVVKILLDKGADVECFHERKLRVEYFLLVAYSDRALNGTGNNVKLNFSR